MFLKEQVSEWVLRTFSKKKHLDKTSASPTPTYLFSPHKTKPKKTTIAKETEPIHSLTIVYWLSAVFPWDLIGKWNSKLPTPPPRSLGCSELDLSGRGRAGWDKNSSLSVQNHWHYYSSLMWILYSKVTGQRQQQPFQSQELMAPFCPLNALILKMCKGQFSQHLIKWTTWMESLLQTLGSKSPHFVWGLGWTSLEEKFIYCEEPRGEQEDQEPPVWIHQEYCIH